MKKPRIRLAKPRVRARRLTAQARNELLLAVQDMLLYGTGAVLLKRRCPGQVIGVVSVKVLVAQTPLPADQRPLKEVKP